LVETNSGRSGKPAEETLHSYDEAVRPLSITHSIKKGDRTEFQYDAQGRKRSIQYFDLKTLQRLKGGIWVDGSLWDASVSSGIGVPANGKIATIYNEKDQPMEAQILDANGQVVTRFVRTYDADGRTNEEKSICGNVARGAADHLVESIPPQLRDGVTPEEVDRLKEIISKIIGSQARDSIGNQSSVRARSSTSSTRTTRRGSASSSG
jgi:YD repeat-containing protein